MKTAMQLMLEDLELRYKVLSDAQMIQACAAIEGTMDYAKSLIIKEKEQIMKANMDGYKEGCTYHSFDHRPKTTEQYYNQTYNN